MERSGIQSNDKFPPNQLDPGARVDLDLIAWEEVKEAIKHTSGCV